MSSRRPFRHRATASPSLFDTVVEFGPFTVHETATVNAVMRFFQPGIESYISGMDFWQDESRQLEWSPVFRKYQNFEEIPLDNSMFAVFERDKAKFTNAIRGSGFEEGSRQGLLL